MLLSDEVCAINDYSYEVSSTCHPKLADNQAFGVPALVTIKRDNTRAYDLNGFITIAAFAKYIDSQVQTDRESSSDRVLINNYCQFYQGYFNIANIHRYSIDGYCSNLYVVKNNNPFTLQTNFTALQWRKPTLSSTFQAGVSSVLQTSTAALSSTIEVVSNPTNLDVNYYD